MTNYNDGKWHGWDGGECPVHPETMVAAIAANGNMMIDTFAPSFIEREASTITWSKGKDEARAAIVAFRVVKEYRDPRDRWAYLTHMFDSFAEAESFRAQVDADYPGRGYLDAPITHWWEVVD